MFAHGNDPCLSLFALAWPALFDFPRKAKVLEIGCAEADWLTPMKAARPDLHLTGIDWRGCKRPGADVLVRGNVLEQAFALESFDAVVLISALEHIGLGHYDQDPGAPDGDRTCLQLAFDWLKPNGGVYFDVPWNPDPGYAVRGSECRVYDDATLTSRLMDGRPWQDRHRQYATRLDASRFVARPEKADPRFHYVACVWTKPARAVEFLG